MSIMIQAENVSKQYRLGVIGTGTLSHDLNRWWARIRGKNDPFQKVWEENDRETRSESEYVWALRDINFEVKQGEVLGIIGRNGAGKSTLLKILSRVTGPTQGIIRTRGRIASLLEVGTGFHSELTGRENIFLNGAMLGMDKPEIRKKLDEIIEFAGVERYVDTPVKRYSSGMYVRLAFAVAAHLEPEILVIDEVLAVGDAAFQKKCIGKMKEVSGEGRTVLFVSHNMDSVSRLCTRGMLLHNGTLKQEGDVQEIIKGYYNLFQEAGIRNANRSNRKNRTLGGGVFSDFSLLDRTGKNAVQFTEGDPMHIRLGVEIEHDINGLGLFLGIRPAAAPASELITTVKKRLIEGTVTKGRRFQFDCHFDSLTLRPGTYSFYIGLGNYDCNKWYDLIDQNVDLPIFTIHPITEDVQLQRGYFTMDSRVEMSQL